MFLYAPPSLPKNAPLVVILHGCTQSALIYDDGAGWSQLAAHAGFAVLAPEQTRENNPNGCFNWFQPADTVRGEGETHSIYQMIKWALSNHDLDRGRVFITGLSAGGAMATSMLSAYPEVFAGGAIIAGLPSGSAANIPEALSSMRQAPRRSSQDWATRAKRLSDHSGRWPRISIWHGTDDMTVHPSNAEALIAQWTHIHGVAVSPDEDSFDDGHRCRIWHGGDGGSVVEAVTLTGMGHGTPISARQHGLGRAGQHFVDLGISSTMRIAEFWGLPAEKYVARPHEKNVRTPTNEKGLRGILVSALKSAGLM